MEKQNIETKKTYYIQDRTLFQSETRVALEATDVKELLSKMIHTTLTKSNKVLNVFLSYF